MIQIVHVPSGRNLADVCTKPLTSVMLDRLMLPVLYVEKKGSTLSKMDWSSDGYAEGSISRNGKMVLQLLCSNLADSCIRFLYGAHSADIEDIGYRLWPQLGIKALSCQASEE